MKRILQLAGVCAFAIAGAAALPAVTVISADFENGMLPDAGAPSAVTVIDTARARSGRASLRICKKEGASNGAFQISLDGRGDFSAGCEFSLWVYTEKRNANVAAYISAVDDDGGRYIVCRATGNITPGKWCQLSGTVFPGDWHGQHRDFTLNVRTDNRCWLDDVVLRTGLPESPSQAWPMLKDALRAAADKRASPLAPGGSLVLESRHSALAPDTARVEISLPAGSATVIPAEGILVFAVDAKDDLDLTGVLHLEPDADLRPAIRVTVLCNDTVIGAPAVKAASWKLMPKDSDRPGPAPDIRGEQPPSTVALAPWRMTKGRHYIAISGPHIRPGGTFVRLELQARDRPAAPPLYSFALLADTHIGFGSTVLNNLQIQTRMSGEVEAVLRQLKRENVVFAIHAGDMTANSRRNQFAELAGAVKRGGVPVYACLGNHDTSRDSRGDIADTIPKLFPSGPRNTDYVFSHPPLRFIVLDGSHWRGKGVPTQGFKTRRAGQQVYRDGMLDWLRDTLAKDTVTPTIVISHYEFYRQRGVSDLTGYNLGSPSKNKEIMDVLDNAPNVVATLSGHHHYNGVGTYNGITCIMNPAIVEWPNAYRVFRVYADHMEWEIRQIPDRGLIRQGVVLHKAVLWALSTNKGDLAGTVNLRPRATGKQ